MSASPAPANADFTERLERIRERQTQNTVVAGPAEHLALQREQLVQKLTRAGGALGIMAALLLGFYILGQSGPDPDAAPTCAPVVAAAKPTVLKLNTHKSSGRKSVTPEVAAEPDCTP